MRAAWERLSFSAGVRTALAAGLAWEIARLLPGGGSKPYFAALGAILTAQVTVAGSLARGGQRVLGVVAGVGLSLLAAHVLGLSALAVALLVWLAMGFGTLLRLGPQGVSQVAVSALLVLSLGARPGYAAARLVDTVIGAAVAVALNALLWPPDPLRAAGRALGRLAGAQAAVLDALAAGRLGRARVRTAGLRVRLAAAEEALAAAAAEVRVGWPGRGRQRLRRLRRAFGALERTAGAVRATETEIRLLRVRGAGAAGVPAVAVLAALAAALRAFGVAFAEAGGPGRAVLARRLGRAGRAVAAARRALARAAEAPGASEAVLVLDHARRAVAVLAGAAWPRVRRRPGPAPTRCRGTGTSSRCTRPDPGGRPPGPRPTP
ncbi:MAG: FUSC family protein [Actinomycetia bacterium]|nr:FUSC family protein [Actinomycetes bacterium]